MDFFTAVKICFAKYADFTGRAGRAEFWWFALFLFMGDLVSIAILNLLWVIFSLAMLLPRLAVGVRRLHDIDRSGWALLIAFVPVVGWIILLIWFLQKSDAAANRFGPAPLPAHELRAET
jgi:uncharacterized membrane protein YhaH (DUF805 family)